jgi:tryptophan 2,3-dioxygenase
MSDSGSGSDSTRMGCPMGGMSAAGAGSAAMVGASSDVSLTYSSYLKIDELLKLQEPLSVPVAHDELLFITIHQVYELWFKQALFELDSLVVHLVKRDYLHSLRRLERVNEIFRILVSQVDILETMTPLEFNRFRDKLNPASGFQSAQFRELEILGGIDAAEYEKFFELEPEWKASLIQRAKGPNLRDTLFQTLQTEGLLKNDDTESRINAVVKVYKNPKPDSGLRNLCEQLIRFDEQVVLWRFRHVQMVERMIGMKYGTGGSLGVPYLQTTLKKRFFPELWEARTRFE